MAFVKVGSLSQLPPGAVMEVVLGDDSFAVCNAGGELHALSGICPHAGGPIGQGAMQENLVYCPWHEWAYDCRTGENDYDPAVKLDKFAVKTDGDDILLDPETRA
ncbi:MAG TPA: Rieske (2Fe-2S) protein [Bryobacteraceae bacterium]|nr:Rieske (2Fe-2S) protein [Bryobacteraceae bacterium]